MTVSFFSEQANGSQDLMLARYFGIYFKENN